VKFDKEEHKKKAEETELFASTLPATTSGIEWAITAQFYAALHYVSAFFALTNRFHASHGTRLRAIEKDPVLCNLYDDYQELYNISRDARYECMNLRPGHLTFAKNKLEAIKRIVCSHL
jgi:hypothetical protein